MIKTKLDKRGIKSDLPCTTCVSCTVSSRLHKVMYGRQLKKWGVVIANDNSLFELASIPRDLMQPA